MMQNAGPRTMVKITVTVLALLAWPGSAQAELIAHWTFEEGSGTTAFDEAGHAGGPHDGELLPAPPNGPRWVEGVNGLGTALEYDGNDDRIVVESFDVEGPGITIACWIRPNGPGNDNRIVSRSIGGGTPDHWWALVYKNTGRIEFRLRTDAGVNKGTGTQGDPLVFGQWSHIAGTWSSQDQTKRLYINGVEVQSFSQAGTHVITTDEAPFLADLDEAVRNDIRANGVRVGVGNQSPDADIKGDPNAVDRAMDGALDDVRVYNEALTAEQLQQLIADGPAICPEVTTVSHSRTDPIILSADELPTQVRIAVSIPAPAAGTVTVTSSDANVAGDAAIGFLADGDRCGAAFVDVTGVGESLLELSNDLGLGNASARRIIVQELLDLGDIVSAGNGKQGKLPIYNELLPIFGPVVGIDQDFGLFQTNRLEDVPDQVVDVGDQNGLNPISMDGNNETDDSPWIDSVFVVNSDSQAINSAGVTHDFATGDANIPGGWDFILDGREPGGPNLLRIGDYATTEGVGIHASAGMTIDLDALRATHGADAVQFFSAGVGEGTGGVGGTVNNYVILSDAAGILSSDRFGPHSDSGELVEIEIPTNARFLTLAVGDAGDGNDDDHGVFLDASISPSRILDTISVFTVSPGEVTLSAGESVQLQVTQSFAGRGSLGSGAIAADAYATSDATVATVDVSGLIEAVGTGQATISATVGGTVVGTVAVSVVVEGPPPTLVHVMGGIQGIFGSPLDTWISSLGEAVAFDQFGLTTDSPLTDLAAVVAAYTGPGAAPALATADLGADGENTVILDAAIEPGHWLKLDVTATNENGSSTFPVWLGHLPLDINQDGMANIRDATAFGDVFGGDRSLALIDINGDGIVNVRDATAFGENWNGTGDATRAWRNTSLPARP